VFSGCANFSYIFQAARGQLALYNRERPIDEVLKDPKISSKTKDRLKKFILVRDYVEKVLNLKSTDNYKTYVELNRPYVVWVVTASEPYELKLIEHSFLFLGKFPYLGFFNEKDALSFKKEKESLGFDTSIRGASAYSTLGFLKDPLLSSMLSDNEKDFANLLFHETTHTYIYIKNEGSFNEQIASMIGDLGERKWIVDNYGNDSVELKEWEKYRLDKKLFSEVLTNVKNELNEFYKKEKFLNASLDEKKFLKEKKFLEIQNNLKLNYLKKFLSKNFTNWFENIFLKKLTNNAYLLSLLTYDENQSLYDEIMILYNYDLVKIFYKLMDFQKYVKKEKIESSKLLNEFEIFMKK
jgi:predicted aminopeptidase